MSERTGSPDNDDALDFEASLERLEALVDQLEGGELPLEQALQTFESGVALTRRCSEALDAAERRVELLVREGGRFVARPHEIEDAPDDGSG